MNANKAEVKKDVAEVKAAVDANKAAMDAKFDRIIAFLKVPDVKDK